MHVATQVFDNEWYAIGLAEEFKPGRKKSVRLHGLELVVWRKKDGTLGCLEAKCPHMGASLAVGRVVGEHVECPYHGFQYDDTGRCIKTPLRPDDARIPKTLCTRAFAIQERCDWVFVFWGEARDATTPAPFFEQVEAVNDKLMHSWSVKTWPVHFTRFIENTVDVAHLGTVHRGTLSWSLPDPITVGNKVEGNFISVFPPSTTELPVFSQIIYPNMALLYLSPKFLTVFAGVPIDDEHTRLYVRSSFGFVRLPLIGHFATWLKHQADMAALWQDEAAMLSVRPINTDDAAGEVLMDFELHIAEYRKMRKRKLEQLGQDGTATDR